MEYLFNTPESKLYGLTIFIAIVFFQIVYIFLQWLYIRRMEYLYYAAYMMVTVIYALNEFEEILSLRLFSRFHPDCHWYVRHSLPMLIFFLYYRFARAFLNLPETCPVLNKWVVRLEYFILVYAIISPVLILSGIGINVEEIIFIAVCTVLSVSSVLFIFSFLKNSIPLTGFAMLGAVLLLTGSVITLILLVLQNHGFDLPFDPYLPLLVCVIAELITFTTGLSFKARLVEKEKLGAEQALTKEFIEREKLESGMHELQNKIAGDLHDDVGATLSGISIYTEVAKKRIAENKVGEAVDFLERINDYATETQVNLREMIWVLNPDNELVQDLLDRFGNYSKPLLAAKNIAFDFKVDDELLEKKLSILQRRNVYLILKECINNIMKHADCRSASISLEKYGGNGVSVLIFDDGKGFDSNGNVNGNGLKNMKGRMKELKGNLEVITTQGKGTTVKFEFPFQ